MGIYIFEPSGAGGSQTLQQVLTTGSTLTQNNSIFGSAPGGSVYSLSFLEMQIDFGGYSYTQYSYFTFLSNSANSSTTFIGYNGNNEQGIYIDNYASTWKFGDFLTNGGCIIYEPALLNKFRIVTNNILLIDAPNIDHLTDSFRFFEQAVGSLFKTTANIGTFTPPNKVAGYMAIEINSIIYHIPLYNQ